jgi:histone deacetylase 6
MRGENVIDENLIFGIIGIADSINTMVFGEVVVNPTGSLYAGVYYMYILGLLIIYIEIQNNINNYI